MTSIPMFTRYPPPTVIPPLNQVLTSGNSAGTNDIDMNNQNILSVNNVLLNTINGIPYPPPNNFKLNTYTSNITGVSIPSDITYIVITLTGGGGGAGRNSTSGTSTTCILYENGIQVSGSPFIAVGGSNNNNGGTNPAGSWDPAPISAPPNSGAGGMNTQAVYNSAGLFVQGQNGQTISYSYQLTSGNTYTYDISIGAGGSNGGGGSFGGSGIAYVTFY